MFNPSSSVSCSYFNMFHQLSRLAKQIMDIRESLGVDISLGSMAFSELFLWSCIVLKECNKISKANPLGTMCAVTMAASAK